MVFSVISSFDGSPGDGRVVPCRACVRGGKLLIVRYPSLLLELIYEYTYSLYTYHPTVPRGGKLSAFLMVFVQLLRLKPRSVPEARHLRPTNACRTIFSK